MNLGWAMPLALAALAGSVWGWWGMAGGVCVWGVAIALAVARGRWRWLAMLVVVGLCAWQVAEQRSGTLPEGLSRQDVTLAGRVTQVRRDQGLTRLRVAVTHCAPQEAGLPPCDALSRVRLSWYDAPVMHTGERWRWRVRLRPPQGFANGYGFDYAAWLWREGIQATGYVRDSSVTQRLSGTSPTLRDAGLAFLDTRELSGLATRWLSALTLGVSERLTQDDWDLLNATGTTHLMVISGLHVGLVASVTLLLLRLLARGVTPGHWRLATWPWWLAGLATLGYAAMAGFEPPALRATVMALLGLWVASGRHAPGPWQAWWLALLVIVVSDPLTVWRPGLWLSFLAVGVLIAAWQGRPAPRGVRGWLWALARSQCLLAPFMAAAVLIGFERLAPVGPLVNLVAVPLVGSIMVPLGLLGWALAWSPTLAIVPWHAFDGLAHIVWKGLTLAAAWLPVWSPPIWETWPLALILAALGMVWLIPGLVGYIRLWASVSLIVLAFALRPPAIAPGRVVVVVHDVGQGQLVELRSATQHLLFDTGPRYGSGFTPAESLWPAGRRFDDVIVSHSDRDHAGGVATIDEMHHVARWWGPPDMPVGVATRACRWGVEWQRDGVDYRFLSPVASDVTRSDNDRSCVLQVTAGDQRLLITGDASTAIERRLLVGLEHTLTVLVAGHHGSRTSSSPAFVARTRPRHVIFSAGRDNAHGHPHPEVVRRFRRAGSCLWNTATDGALRFTLGVPAPRMHPARPPSGVEGACIGVESGG
ncbi:DNA internalization-related competence protein ComEC/Rec2 [Chromohalobacter nigrandesensis]|uniref:DNA internalization-related competence protein ComEC/Rec2 n=1 Tax=Chromohalobacter nigrandesensis TaxID=119863 RepID=UPI001FF3D524|nr:DNA internalization-related competence protein ComEC/Rec2 [Chromohalobacter nigrandesensis]MCK0743789.1 DNA internalization-related competence protein ComEC/Rec2 [Chromohalobacter nigrandesensis]